MYRLLTILLILIPLQAQAFFGMWGNGGFGGGSSAFLPPSGSTLALALDGTDSGLTFTRASGAVNPETGLWAPENLFTKSSNLANSYWDNNGSSITKSGNTITFGTSVQDRLVNNLLQTASGTFYLTARFSPTNAGKIIRLVVWSSTLNFDTSPDLVIPSDGVVTYNWTTNGISIAGLCNNTTATTGTVTVINMQITRNPNVYVATDTLPVLNSPRYVTGKSGNGTLIEGSSTQQWISTSFATSWVTSNAALTHNQADRYGTNTAIKLTESGVNSFHAINLPNANYAISAAPYTASIWAKAGTRNWLGITVYDGSTHSVAWYNVASGTTGTVGSGVTASIVPGPNGWYKCVYTRNMLGGGNSGTNVIYMSNADNTTNYQGDGTSFLYVHEPQLAVGTYPTSYTPNLASTGTVTRAAENISSPTAGVISSTGSAVGIWYKPGALSTNTKTLWSSYTDASNWTSLEYTHGVGFTATKRVLGVTTQATAAVSASTTAFTQAILAINADKTLSLYVNGVPAGTNTTNTTGTPVVAATMQEGALNGTLQADGVLDSGRYYNTPITAAQALQWYKSGR